MPTDDDRLLWCDECLALLPYTHKRPTFCRAYRALHWLGGLFIRVGAWIGEWGDVAQMRANRRAGLRVDR